MPFELGLAMGAKHFGDKGQKKKTALVMVTTRYALPPALSDMAGADQQPHNDDPQEVIKIVSRYLHRTPDGQPVPGAQWIVESFNVFKNETLRVMAKAARRTLAEVDPIDDFRVYNRFVIEHCSEAAIRGSANVREGNNPMTGRGHVEIFAPVVVPKDHKTDKK
jgi:hypothetical protein